jgi:endonuclease III
MENSHDAFSYAIELILSQNPRYTNFNATREELKIICQNQLSLYNLETDQLIVYLDNNEINFSKKKQKKNGRI